MAKATSLPAASPTSESARWLLHPANLALLLPQIKGDICRAIEMDRSYMSAIEGGKVNVTLSILEKLANALDVSVDELLK